MDVMSALKVPVGVKGEESRVPPHAGFMAGLFGPTGGVEMKNKVCFFSWLTVWIAAPGSSVYSGTGSPTRHAHAVWLHPATPCRFSASDWLR